MAMVISPFFEESALVQNKSETSEGMLNRGSRRRSFPL
jgi:hypothetical protein